jgi:hypothetical protein
VTEESTRYYKLNVDELPRGTAKEWARELSPDGRERVKVTVMELQGSVYYVAISTKYIAELFEERLRRRDVRIDSTTTPPPVRSRSSASSSSASSRSSSGGSRREKSGGSFWDDVFDGIGDFIGDLFD